MKGQNQQADVVIIVLGTLLLLLSIVIYYNWPILAEFSAKNPIPCNQIAPAAIVTIVIWSLSAFLDPPRYFNYLNFLGTSITFTTLFTGFFILAKVSQ